MQWETIVKGNPKPDITWTKDGEVLEKGDRFDFEEDKRNNRFTLIIKSVEVEDKGVYRVSAKNYLGDASAEASLTPHSNYYATILCCTVFNSIYDQYMENFQPKRRPS